jgi:hypothetical protein
MIKLSRKFVLVITVAVFLLNSANFFLYIHLSEHKADAGHDSEKCPICQQAAVNKDKTIVPTDSVVYEILQATFSLEFTVELFVKSFDFLIPYLRAPPAAA